MFSIVLIGTGEIGSRYLQGLIKVKKKIRIVAIEPLITSRNLAQQRWLESGGNNSQHEIIWSTDLNHKFSRTDLVIIATSSFNRATLISDIKLKIKPKYWIIEKILAQSIQDLNSINKNTRYAKGIWVNKPRRLMKWHKKFKSLFNKRGPLKINKIGGLWGLACNSIHFIDLTSWWTEESLISLNSDKLDKVWIPSKRINYFEITGELVANFSGGSKLSMKSSNVVMEDILKVATNDQHTWEINEKKSTANSSKGEILIGQLENQSEFTGKVIDQIMIKGTCELPTIEESTIQHQIFLNVMLKHWNNSQKLEDKKVPIT